MSDPYPLRQRFIDVMNAEGVADDNVHSWRCFDKARYPEPCDCVATIADELLNALAESVAQGEAGR